MTDRKRKTVGIVILNWNRKDDTIDCLSSIRESQYPHYSIIVVDNASADNSCKEIETQFPDVKLIKNKSNLGFPKGNNIGIEWIVQNNFEYVLLLNNDTTVETNFLSELLVVAASNPEIGIVGSKIVYYSNPQKIWSVGGFINKRTGRPYHFQNDIFLTNDSHFCNVAWVSACALLIRTSVVKQIGLLDSDYFFGTEDVDWCLRAKKSGWNIALAQNSVVKHKKQESKLIEKYSSLQHYYTLRNMLLFVKKHRVINLPFTLSFCNTLFKRSAWAILTLDFKSIRAIILAVYDFYKKRFGKTNYAL